MASASWTEYRRGRNARIFDLGPIGPSRMNEYSRTKRERCEDGITTDTTHQLNGHRAGRPADVPTIINVVREVARAHRNGTHDALVTSETDRMMLREVSDTMREAFIPDRLADTLV